MARTGLIIAVLLIVPILAGCAAPDAGNNSNTSYNETGDQVVDEQKTNGDPADGAAGSDSSETSDETGQETDPYPRDDLYAKWRINQSKANTTFQGRLVNARDAEIETATDCSGSGRRVEVTRANDDETVYLRPLNIFCVDNETKTFPANSEITSFSYSWDYHESTEDSGVDSRVPGGDYVVKLDFDGVVEPLRWTIPVPVEDDDTFAGVNFTTTTAARPESDTGPDTTGPIIHGFAFSDTSLDAGDTITITVNASDETAIERLYFRFEHTEGGGAVFDAYRDFDPPVDSGQHTITYQWPDDAPDGTYEATWISARDSIGNRASWEDGFPLDKKQLDVNSPSSDTNGPVIHDFSVSNDTFRPGETMTITVNATDETNIARLYLRYEHVDGGGAVFDAYQDFDPAVESGTYNITYEWPENTPGGTYEGTWISAEDSIGNKASWEEQFSTEKKQLQIDSETSDTEGPVIQSFSISDDTFQPGEEMTITVNATDETDIARLYFRFEHEDGGGAVYDAYLDFDPAVGNGTYDIHYEWPEDTPGGTYEATWIYGEDSIGNTASWENEFSEEQKTIEVSGQST